MSSPERQTFSRLVVARRSRGGHIAWAIDSRDHSEGTDQIGALYYSNGTTGTLKASTKGVAYEVTIAGEQFVPGLYLASHRSMSAYQPVQSVPPQFSAISTLFSEYFSELSKRYRGSQSGKSPLMRMKESLISAAIYGYGNEAVAPDDEARQVWEGFQDVLRRILPESLGFRRLIVRSPEVVMETDTDDFLIDSVSGGLSSLIEVAWQIFLRSREYDAFTVCFDEPENHLHPSLQRTIIPSLLQAFPRISFVVATHSPFIVTSVDDSHVYVLDYDEGVVYSRLLDSVNKAASSDEVLRRVLGLETTMPLWVENRLAQLLREFDTEPGCTAEMCR